LRVLLSGGNFVAEQVRRERAGGDHRCRRSAQPMASHRTSRRSRSGNRYHANPLAIPAHNRQRARSIGRAFVPMCTRGSEDCEVLDTGLSADKVSVVLGELQPTKGARPRRGDGSAANEPRSAIVRSWW
jgi:hypothetical protein